MDDFNVCQKYPQVPITVPVDDGGYLTELAGKYAGQRVWAANKTILADLTASGAVMGQVHIKHQYPHCWRCHNPIIFRATEQWFCSIAKFREDVYKAIDTVTWMPDWGHDRMTGMVRDRKRLVHQPPAYLGRAHPRLLLQEVRYLPHHRCYHQGCQRSVPQGRL